MKKTFLTDDAQAAKRELTLVPRSQSANTQESLDQAHILGFNELDPWRRIIRTNDSCTWCFSQIPSWVETGVLMPEQSQAVGLRDPH